MVDFLNSIDPGTNSAEMQAIVFDEAWLAHCHRYVLRFKCLSDSIAARTSRLQNKLIPECFDYYQLLIALIRNNKEIYASIAQAEARAKVSADIADGQKSTNQYNQDGKGYNWYNAK